MKILPFNLPLLLAAVVFAAHCAALKGNAQSSNTVPATRVEINGISCLFGSKKVALTVIELRPVSHPAKARRALLLAEGDKDGDLEVLASDEKAETARIRNEGRELALSLAGVSRPAPPPADSSPVAASSHYFLPQTTAPAVSLVVEPTRPEFSVTTVGRRPERSAPNVTAGIIPSSTGPEDFRNGYNL